MNLIKRELRTNKIITFLIFSIWGVIFVFGILTLIGPEWLEELADPGKKTEATALKTAGDNFLKSGHYPLAIAQYKAALTIVPDLKSAISNLAIAYQKTGNYKNAITSFKHLLTLNPEYPGVIYYNLGDIYEKTNQPEKALKCYLLAAGSAAYPEKSYQKSGQLYMNKKDWKNAILNFNLAIDNRQNIENAFKGMLLKTQKSNPDTSEINIEISGLLNSENYKKQLSNYDAGIFNQQLSRDIDLAKTYNNIGYCLALQEKYQESIKYLKIALEIYPTYTQAINNLKIVESYISE